MTSEETSVLDHTRRRLPAAAAALLAAIGLLLATSPPAAAGQVGVTIGIQGAGAVAVVEGSLEDGGATWCSHTDNQDHRVTRTCQRVRNAEAFEAWVWLRAYPAEFPAGQWVHAGWSGCDATRTVDGHEECAVHSGAFSSDERYPVARFRDDVAPTVTGVEVVQALPADRTFRFHFTAGEATECRVVDVTAFAPCTTGFSMTVPYGVRRFEVRSTDPSGNTSGVVGADFVVVDTLLYPGLSSPTSSRVAEFAFNSSFGDEYLCSLDHAPYVLCGGGSSASYTYANLADGQHHFRVYARKGPWVAAVPSTWTWTVDTQPPTTQLNRTTAGDTASFTFTSAGALSFQCRLSRPGAAGTWTSCTSPVSYAGLGQGEHVFSVRGADRAGNVEVAPPSHAWVVDTLAPRTGLAPTTSGGSASFAFAAEGAVGFECRLTTPERTAAWTACTSPTSFDALVPGDHGFEVRARDAAGNVEAPPAAFRWTVTAPAQPGPVPGPPAPVPGQDSTPVLVPGDSAAPETSVTGGPAGFTLSDRASFDLVAEPGATFRCRLDGAERPCGATPLVLSGLRSGTHSLSVAAADLAGNLDPSPAVRTWTVPLTARELGTARGWRLRRSTSAYGGGALVSTRPGSALARKVSGAREVALVASRGRGHGSVRVYAGSRLLRTVRLSARRTQDRVLVPVATFATPYTGRLRIVTTSRREVRIEGLGVATG